MSDHGDRWMHNFSTLDWVIHCGAISSTTESDVEKIMRQNYDSTIEIYEACKYFGVNLQYSSSASIYGMGTEFKETSPPDPRSPYAWTKYLIERTVSKMPSKIIVQGFRYFNVYGEGEDHKGSQASPHHQFAKQARENSEIKVFDGSVNFRRDFVPVENVVEAHLKFLDIKESGVWNVGTGETKSFMDVAKSFNVPIKFIPMPENLVKSYQKYTCADMTKYNEIIPS